MGRSHFALLLGETVTYFDTFQQLLSGAAVAGLTAKTVDRHIVRVRVDQLGPAELEYAKGYLNGRKT